MSVDPTQQPPPPEQGPYVEYGPAGSYDYAQGSYNAPQGAYDPYRAPQTPYPAYNAPQAAPLPLSEAVAQLPGHYWKVLTRPGAASFAQEAGKGGWDIVLIQLIGYTIIDALLGILHLKLYPLAVPATTSTTAINGIDPARVASTEVAIIQFVAGPGLFILVPLVFFIYQGIAFGIARAAHGQGTFVTQSYATLLFFVPLSILAGLIDSIPISYLGALIDLALLIYGLVLSVFAMMGAHRLSGGKASAAAFLPLLGVLLLACCSLFFVLVIAIGNATQ